MAIVVPDEVVGERPRWFDMDGAKFPLLADLPRTKGFFYWLT
jgi:hypothetical protein